jgi:RNA polymerase sigma-70 factor (ECF subfamily)
MNTKELKTLTDECLVKLLQDGDQNAMGELYSRYFSLAHRKCISFTRNVDDANDLAQDLMIRIMEKIHLFKGESKFSTWLYSVTRNYCTDCIRKTKRSRFESINLTYDLSNFEYEEPEEAIIEEDVAFRALDQIPKEDQELLFMKYQFNKSIQELQETYSISTSAVKMRLLRARSRAMDMYRSISMQPASYKDSI